jgi:hypothetical protein
MAALIHFGDAMKSRHDRVKTEASRSFERVRQAVAGLLPVLVLGGCYVVPVTPDGKPAHGTPDLPSGAIVVPYVVPEGSANRPVTLNVRLYPSNDIAVRSGVLTGQVMNLMGGRGRFQFNYKGEVLLGEATRVSDDERRGVASALGASGTHVSCNYQMSSPTVGAGTCTFSDGARYDLHVGR